MPNEKQQVSKIKQKHFCSVGYSFSAMRKTYGRAITATIYCGCS